MKMNLSISNIVLKLSLVELGDISESILLLNT